MQMQVNQMMQAMRPAALLSELAWSVAERLAEYKESQTTENVDLALRLAQTMPTSKSARRTCTIFGRSAVGRWAGFEA